MILTFPNKNFKLVQTFKIIAPLKLVLSSQHRYLPSDFLQLFDSLATSPIPLDPFGVDLSSCADLDRAIIESKGDISVTLFFARTLSHFLFVSVWC